MPLARYGVLAGQVVDRRAEGGTDTPHYQIQVDGGGVEFCPVVDWVVATDTSSPRSARSWFS